MIGSIFLEPWWLNAVAGPSHGLATISAGKNEKAKMAYVVKQSGGLQRIVMPPLSQFVGPWIEASSAKYAKQLSQQKDFVEGLLKQLPKYDVLTLNLDPSFMNGLPFIWHGFDVSVGYTYVLDSGSDIDQVWQGLLPKIRTDIKKAGRTVTVSEHNDVLVLLSQIDKTFGRQNKTRNYSDEIVIRLDNALRDRSQRLILVAKDEEEKVHAAAYFVWDGNAMHYLLGGGDPDLRNSGATSLLLWQGIQVAVEKNLPFNFEGSMVEGIERFFRGFGAKQVPYLRISKESRKAALRRLIRELAWLAVGSSRK